MKKWEGVRFGALTALHRTEEVQFKKRLWLFKCDCGTTKKLLMSRVKSGNDKSCGCRLNENKNKRNKTHGRTYSPTWNSWQNMLERCFNERNIGFKNYGGRGIGVHQRWMKFENFLLDMGERPDGMSIDRIDNNGHYEPGNCKWSTPKQQAQNRRRSHG